MITVYRKNGLAMTEEGTLVEVEIRCNSLDTKPTTINESAIVNGTSLIEIDTGKLYLFDADSSQWKEV